MKTIEQLAIEDMLESIIPRVEMIKYSHLKITLATDTDTIYITDGVKKEYYIGCPHDLRIDGETIEIHGNKRNKICKLFLEQYTIESIKQLEQTFIEQKQIEEKQFEVEQTEMQRILSDEILQLFQHTKLDKQPEYNVWWGNQEPLIQFKCGYSNPSKRWDDGYRNKIEIFFDKHSLNIFSILTGTNTRYGERVCGLSLNGVKAECIRVIAECEQALEVYNKQLKQEYEKQEEIRKINNFVSGICASGKIATILKCKNKYMVIAGRLRFSTGTGKSGKYYNTSESQVLDMINKKGYTEFYQESREVFEMKTDEELKQLNWTKIA